MNASPRQTHADEQTEQRGRPRVLTNMVKNALEAVGEGDTVRVWYECRDGKPAFMVWNLGMIPEKVTDRIFQRSFSTKSRRGRGLGTYSMKPSLGL